MRAHPAGPRSGDLSAGHPLGPPPSDLNALDKRLWPIGLTRQANGALAIRGHDVRDLVTEHGSPVFLMDEADVRQRCRDYLEAFGANVFYAGKAFLCTAMVRLIEEEGLGLDVCTEGELTLAQRAGFPAGRTVLHGSNKSVRELAAAVDAGISCIVLDSFAEIDRLAAVCRQRGTRQAVMVRTTVGVEAHTHEFIATAHEDQKFGFSLSGGAAAQAVARALASPELELVGVHSHIGSQIFDAGGFETAAHRVVGLLAQIRDEHGVSLPQLDLGGGLGIAYTSHDDPADVREMGASIRSIVEHETRAHGLPLPSLSVEPGRGIVGPGSVTVYEVGTVKRVGDLRTFISVDGGFTDNLRTALYDADFTVVLASRASAAPPVLSRVVGKHCESGDVLVKNAWLPGDVRPGDLLAVAATGAYCRSMASTYNVMPRPPVVAVTDAGSRPIIRRETIEDLLALDVP